MGTIPHPEKFLKEFKALPNWLVWREEERKGRATKVPYSAAGGVGSSTDASTWTSYEVALAAVPRFDGLGFAITDGNVLVDLDGCCDSESGVIEEWAQFIVDFLQCPTEVSPSGTGLHVYVRSKNARSLKRMFNKNGERKQGIEIYAGGRYSCITFNHLPGTPIEIPEIDLEQFISFVSRGDFDPAERRINDSVKRWEQEENENTKRVCAHPKAPLDLERWLTAFHVNVLRRKPDGTLLVECPGTHGKYDKGDRHAFLRQMESGALAMGCLHQSCSLYNGNGNHWREFRQMIEGTRFTREEPNENKNQETPSTAEVPAPAYFSADDFLLEKIPDRERLMWDRETNAPLLYRSSINEIFAYRGQGKTIVTLAMVGAMIHGTDFLRYHATGGLRALLVDGELPLIQLQERVRDFIGESGGRLALMSPERMPKGQRFPVLSVLMDQQLFLAQLEVLKPDVIVFDSLTRVFKFDTNDPGSWLVVNDFLLELRFRGYCVLIVHHAGKGGLQRGRSDGDDHLDISIKLSAPERWQPGDGLQFQWDFEKVRHAGNLPGFYASLDSTGLWTIKNGAHEEEVLELLYQGKSIRTVARELEISKSAVHRIKSAAEKKGTRFHEKEDGA
jgi:putative DNA primase/helicase